MVTMAPYAHIFGHPVSNWWHSFGRIRRHSLVGGGVSLGASSEVSKFPLHSHAALVPRLLPPACRRAPCYDGHVLKPSATMSPQIRLAWSWCCVTATETKKGDHPGAFKSM